MLTLSLVGCKLKTFKEPVISLDAYKIVDGFDLKVVASEPFIEAPVVMDFDNKGRMWIVEMKGYMQNLEGTGEDEPNGEKNEAYGRPKCFANVCRRKIDIRIQAEN